MQLLPDVGGVAGYPEVTSDHKGSSAPHSAFGEWGCRVPASKGADKESPQVSAPTARVRRGASLRQRSAALRPAWGARMPTGKTVTAVVCTSSLREGLREGLKGPDPSTSHCQEPMLEPPTKENWCPAFLCNPPHAHDIRLPDAIIGTLAAFSERVQLRSSVLLGWDHPQLRAFFSQQMHGLGNAIGSTFLAYQAFATWRSFARQSALVQRFRDVTASSHAETENLQNLLSSKVDAYQSLLSAAQHVESQRDAALSAAAQLVAGPQSGIVLKRCLTEWQRATIHSSYQAAVLQQGHKQAGNMTVKHQNVILRQCLTIWRRQALQKSQKQSARIRSEWLDERAQVITDVSLCHICCLAWRNVVLQLGLSVALGQAQHGMELAAGAAKVQQKTAALLHRSSETSGKALVHQCIYGWMQVAKAARVRSALENAQDQVRLVSEELAERQKIAGRRLLAMLYRSVTESGAALLDQCFRGWCQSMRLDGMATHCEQVGKRVLAIFQRSIASSEKDTQRQCLRAWVQVVAWERERNLAMQKNSVMLQLCLHHLMNSKGPDLRTFLSKWRGLCKDARLQHNVRNVELQLQQSARDTHEQQIERLDCILSLAGECKVREERRRCFLVWKKEAAARSTGTARHTPRPYDTNMDSDYPVVPTPQPTSFGMAKEDWGLCGSIASPCPTWSAAPHDYTVRAGRPEESIVWSLQPFSQPQEKENEQVLLQDTSSPQSVFPIDEQQWQHAVRERRAKEAARKEWERSQQRSTRPYSLQNGTGKDYAASGVFPNCIQKGTQPHTLAARSALGDSDYFNLASSAMLSEESYRELLEYNRRELQSRRGETLKA
eukprot:gnl/MRDRNA2_/MRDRNA2_18112_c0_seq1.p1 gnl/MRDRNA2_/MRDRNA2_18112_c0~~gnl/MRDRNA2_/MRDRNA2_18112_c0_seq1.p1  ORF type:complete len:835 (+),score=143.32 gnl/MRDRNA2_/MRDRNA2_18112_c0_seq1:110-2614(+)